MSERIPVRVFVVAAAAAVRRVGGLVDEVFDERLSSRARLVAIAAVRAGWPRVFYSGIAECFGWRASGDAVGRALANARCAAWWSDEAVAGVTAEVMADLRWPWSDPCEPIVSVEASDSGQPAPNEGRARVWTPRKFAPSRIIVPGAARARNVTSEMMGDPPAGRREALAAAPSLEYPGYYSRRWERRAPSL